MANQANVNPETEINEISDVPELIPFAVPKTSKAGRAIANVLGDGERVTVPMDNAQSLIAKVQGMRIAGMKTIPVAYAGGSFESLQASGADNATVGFLSRKSGAANSVDKGQTEYICLVAIPAFSVADIQSAGDEGAQWLQKIIDRETAAIGWRPLRKVEEGESFDGYAQQIPTALHDYLTTQSRAIPGMDVLEYLWQQAHAMIAQMQPRLVPLLPKATGKASLETVSKALRSKSWAERNTPALESYGIWTKLVGRTLTDPAVLEVLNDTLREGAEEEGVSFSPLSADAIAGWLATRDEVDIEPIGTRAPKDFSALEDWAASFGGDGE